MADTQEEERRNGAKRQWRAIDSSDSDNNTHPLAILNTSIVTEDGVYHLETIGNKRAIDMISKSKDDEIDSAIGHQAVADIISNLSGRKIEVNRQQFGLCLI